MKKTLFIEIECGEKTCASESGKFCPFMSTRRYGTEWVCALFPTEIMFFTDLEEKEGWIQRCDECLATEEKYNKLGLEERIDNYLAKALPKEVRSLDRDVSYQRINSLACSKGCQALNIRLADNQPFRSNSALRAQLTYQILPGEGFIPQNQISNCQGATDRLYSKRKKKTTKISIPPTNEFVGFLEIVSVKKWSRLVFAAGLKEES